MMSYSIMAITIFLTVVGLGGIGYTFAIQQALCLLALIPFVIMLFIVAPYNLWKENRKRLDKLTTRKLQICHDTSTDTKHIWLAVTTDCGENLELCYAKLVDCALKDGTVNKWIRCDGLGLLQHGLLFIWKENNDTHVTIAGNQSKSYIRILETGQNVFGIPMNQGIIPIKLWGIYNFIVEFGTHSTKNPFKQTIIEMEVKVEAPRQQGQDYSLELLELRPYQISISEVI